MGCDIHLHEEIRFNNEWHHYGAPNISRDYKLFTKMANVRSYYNDVTPISEPKGLPNEISDVTKLALQNYGIDAHSKSWLNPKEIYDLYEWLIERNQSSNYWFVEDNLFDYCFGSGFDGFYEYGTEGTSIPKCVEDVRFVFWFDN